MSAQAQQRRGVIDRIIGLAVLAGGFAKFFAFFVSFAAYSLWFGSWQFGLGFVLLILVHELGHVIEARRQRLPVTFDLFDAFLEIGGGLRGVADLAVRPAAAEEEVWQPDQTAARFVIVDRVRQQRDRIAR